MLVKAHSEALQEEFQRLLDGEREEDLQRMYNLLFRIENGLDPLRARFEGHVKKAGLDAVERILDPAKESDPVRFFLRFVFFRFVARLLWKCV